jgi:electron transfer flavoprotein alpha subunit
MAVLVLAEHNEKQVSPSTFGTITAAKDLSQPLHIVVMGASCQKVAEELSMYDGVEKVWRVEDSFLAHPIAENLTETLVELGKDYQVILAPSTTFGKNVLPRVAALLDVALVSDVVKIIDHKTFVRPIYAGNALATVTSEDTTKVLTIRPTAFEATKKGSSKALLEDYPYKKPSGPCPTFVKMEASRSTRPDLTSASIVVAGGRGFQTKENFVLLEKLADQLGAAIGASRAAVDAGFVPNDYQVGQTGKVVAPDLYIAIGISGAIQHLAGMKESKVIVAINKDPEAPIFQIATYGLEGDLFTLLPELIEKLK